jgi:hypothetical protein
MESGCIEGWDLFTVLTLRLFPAHPKKEAAPLGLSSPAGLRAGILAPESKRLLLAAGAGRGIFLCPRDWGTGYRKSSVP